VVTGETVFIGSCSGTFFALNKRSGHTLWTYNIKQDGNQSSFHGDALIVGSRVFVGADRGTDPTGEGHIYAFDVVTGKVFWKYLAAPGVSPDLLLDDSRLIAYCGNGELVALGLESGRPIWKQKITTPDPDRYLPSPVLFDHTVFAAATTSTAVAVRARDGKVLWERELEPAGYLQIMIVGNELYVLSSAKYIYKLDKDTGRITAKKDLQAAPTFVPSQTTDSILVEFADRTLRRIRKGEGLWTARADGELTTHKPLVLKKVVVVADDTGKLAAWNLEDGVLQWSTTFHHLKAPITTLGADSETLYVGTQDGTLYALSLRELQRGKE